MGWLIALAVVFLLAILPLGASVKYNSDGPLVRIIAGPIRFTVFPLKKKENKPEKRKEAKDEKKPVKAAKKKPDPAQKSDEKKPESGGSLLDFLPLVQVALDFLDDFRWKLRLNRLDLKLIMAADDPCDLAINYGRAWAAAGNLIPLLERAFVIKKRDIEVECDFTADATRVYAKVDVTITVGRALCLLTRYGVKLMKDILNLKKLRKGGAEL